MKSLKVPVESLRQRAVSSTSRPSWFIDRKGSDYCEVCRRETGTTAAATCLRCAQNIVNDRRRAFPRSDGNVYMRRFGFKNYFDLGRGREKERVRVV